MDSILSIIGSLVTAGSARMPSGAGQYLLALLPSSTVTSPVISFLISLNPFILIVLGVIVFFAGKFAKFVGVVIVILGLIDLLFPYLMRVG